MKFFKILSIAFLSLIVLFFVIGLLLPKAGTFDKTYEINAEAGIVEDKIFEIYQEHQWPIWNFEDTTVVFIDFDGGYKWEGDDVGEGECQYGIGVDMSVRDHISIKGKEMAETVWAMKSSNPVELTVTFKVFAGGNISARWTNLFLKGLIGQDVDLLVKSIKEKVEL